MDVISEKDYDEVDLKKDAKGPVQTNYVTEEELNSIMKKLDKPVDFQKRMAAKMFKFIEKRMEDEMREKGFLSNFTRHWIREYNDLVNNLQKNLYGDKSVSINLHKMSHAHIASFIREHNDIVPNKKDGKPVLIEFEDDERYNKRDNSRDGAIDSE